MQYSFRTTDKNPSSDDHCSIMKLKADDMMVAKKTTI